MAENNIILSMAGGGPPRNPVKEVIGRDAFVDRLKNYLAYTSVQMYAPRRLGKSWVLRLLEAKAEPDAKGIYFDLERVQDTYELVVEFAKATKLSFARFHAGMNKILESIVVKGVKMEDYSFPWKTHLDAIFKKINSSETPVWLLLDEFPMVIDNLIANKKPEVATELLDYLRYSRQNYLNIKFVLTGSIGLHWMIDKLEETGWRNPQNDDEKITLEPLELKDATLLAEGILRGIEEKTEPGRELAKVTNGHPFYIQKAITRWSDRKTNEDMETFCDRIAGTTEDPFEFNDLDKRLGHYFGREANLAKRVIDSLAEEIPVLPKEIAQKLNSDPEDIINILRKLDMDGYTKTENGKYHLHPALFRRWWKNKREGLYD